MRTTSQIHVVSDLVAGSHASSCSVLQAEVREAVRSRAADIDFRDAEALRPDASIEADRRGIHACVAAFLELTESIPAQAECVDEIWIEDVYFADSEVIGNRRRHTEPGTQLRAAT